MDPESAATAIGKAIASNARANGAPRINSPINHVSGFAPGSESFPGGGAMNLYALYYPRQANLLTPES